MESKADLMFTDSSSKQHAMLEKRSAWTVPFPYFFAMIVYGHAACASCLKLLEE